LIGSRVGSPGGFQAMGQLDSTCTAPTVIHLLVGVLVPHAGQVRRAEHHILLLLLGVAAQVAFESKGLETSFSLDVFKG
jgi:hypothetical protein